MNEDSEYRDAIRLGLRRAGMHWLRASYEVVAGVSALLTEVAHARHHEAVSDDDDPEDEGPIRIELD